MQTLLATPQVQLLETQSGLQLSQPAAYREITPEESRQLRYGYRDGALARNSEAIGKNDSTSIFLTRDMLEKLLELVDENRDELTFTRPGVVAHWATFPADYPDPSLAGRQTLVIEAGSSHFAGTLPCPPVCTGGPGGH